MDLIPDLANVRHHGCKLGLNANGVSPELFDDGNGGKGGLEGRDHFGHQLIVIHVQSRDAGVVALDNLCNFLDASIRTGHPIGLCTLIALQGLNGIPNIAEGLRPI